MTLKMTLTKKQLRDEIEQLQGFGYARWLYNKYNKSELKKEFETLKKQDSERKEGCKKNGVAPYSSVEDCLLCRGTCPIS